MGLVNGSFKAPHMSRDAARRGDGSRNSSLIACVPWYLSLLTFGSANDERRLALMTDCRIRLLMHLQDRSVKDIYTETILIDATSSLTPQPDHSLITVPTCQMKMERSPEGSDRLREYISTTWYFLLHSYLQKRNAPSRSWKQQPHLQKG